MFLSFDSDTDFCDIVVADLQVDILALFLFTISY